MCVCVCVCVSKMGQETSVDKRVLCKEVHTNAKDISACAHLYIIAPMPNLCIFMRTGYNAG